MELLNSENNYDEEYLKLDLISTISDFRYNSIRYIYSIGSNGGYIALTNNYKYYNPNIKSYLTNNIVVVDNIGNIIQNFFVSLKVISLSFLEDNNILYILENGEIIEGDILTGKTKFYMLTPKEYYNKNPVVYSKIYNNSIIYSTSNNNLYFVSNFRKINITEIEINNENNNKEIIALDIYYDNNSQEYYIYYSLESQNLNIIKIKNNTIINKITQNMPNHIILSLTISSDNKVLIILTNKKELYTSEYPFNNNLTLFKVLHELPINENILNNEIDILWLENHSIFMLINNNFYVVNNINLYNINYKLGNIDIEDNFLIKRTFEGIKIIKIIKQSNSSNIYILRKMINNYYNSTSLLCLEPGAILYNAYKIHMKNKPLDDEDIRYNNKLLKDGILQLIDCVKFETNKKKTTKFLKAISFGKLFLADNDNFIKNYIKDICIKLKIINNINICLNRTITFKEYEAMTFDDIIKLLSLYNKFDVLFTITSILNKEEYNEQIFLLYCKHSIDNSLNDNLVSNKIIKLSIKLFNDKFENILYKVIVDNPSIKEKKVMFNNIITIISNKKIKIELFIHNNNYIDALLESFQYSSTDTIHNVLNLFFKNCNINERILLYKNEDININLIAKFLLYIKNYNLLKELIDNYDYFNGIIIYYYYLFKINNDIIINTDFENKYILIKYLYKNENIPDNIKNIINEFVTISSKILELSSNNKEVFDKLSDISVTKIIELKFLNNSEIGLQFNNIIKYYSEIKGITISKESIAYKLITIVIKNDYNTLIDSIKIILEECLKNKIKLRINCFYYILENYNKANIITNYLTYFNVNELLEFFSDNNLNKYGYITCKKLNKSDKIQSFKQLLTQKELEDIEKNNLI